MITIKKYRQKKWKVAFATVISLVFIVTICLALLEYQYLEKYKQQVINLETQLASYQRVTYVAKEKLPKGTVLAEDKVYKEIRYSDSLQSDFITEKDFGKAVVLDVPEGTCMTMTMLGDKESSVRQIFFSQAELSDYLFAGNRIDVRIRYKNAEDYIVLSDKILMQRDSESGMVLELTEEEILLLSSALADSELYDGTKLYAVGYPEYGHVETGSVTYIPNNEILTLLGREKSEGESRAALEERLMQKQ